MREDNKIKKDVKKELKKGKKIAFLDEVGTGAIFGNILVCCIIPRRGFYHARVNDSKKLSPEVREYLCPIILKNVTSYGIGISDHNEINELKSVWKADRMAMIRAINNLSLKPDIVYIDGLDRKIEIPDIEIRYITKGDSRLFGIAAASIVAKVFRDRHIVDIYSKMFPKYKLESNKGYRTRHHIMAIRKYGLTEYHRSYMKKVVAIVNGEYDDKIKNIYEGYDKV